MTISPPHIAVIVPVYKVERYLHKCIQSILRQTYHNYTIVLVNDGSPDRCPEICRDYASKYPKKVHLIDKSRNEGLLRARLSGIDYVLTHNAAESVTFVDSDDYVSRDYLKSMVDQYLKSGTDIVSIQAYRVIGPIKTAHWGASDTEVILQPDLYENYYVSCFGWNRLPINAWGKLITCDLLKRADIKPFDIQLGEDLYISLSLFPHANGWSVIPFRGYYYRVGGMTSNYNPRGWHDFKLMYIYKRNLARKQQYDKAFRWMTIEMKNVLISTVAERIESFGDNEDLRQWLANELADDNLWEDTIAMATFEADPIYRAIADKNLDYIIAFAHQNARKRSFRRVIKLILRKILS